MFTVVVLFLYRKMFCVGEYVSQFKWTFNQMYVVKIALRSIYFADDYINEQKRGTNYV